MTFARRYTTEEVDALLDARCVICDKHHGIDDCPDRCRGQQGSLPCRPQKWNRSRCEWCRGPMDREAALRGSNNGGAER